jgi:hypothetical protein
MDCRVKPGNDNLDIARDLVSVPPQKKTPPRHRASRAGMAFDI